MPDVETLGLSDSSTRSESRIKSLFWPEIQNGSDVDYLGAQGYWVCTLVALLSFVFLIAGGKPFSATAILLFYYLGGVGVRERSRYAAAAVFVMYLLDTLLALASSASYSPLCCFQTCGLRGSHPAGIPNLRSPFCRHA